MGEHNNFEGKRNREESAVGESPFLREYNEAKTEAQRHPLEALSPDKRVVDAKSFASLSDAEREQFQNVLGQSLTQWSKVDEPLRNVYNNLQRSRMNGDENAQNEQWATNYMGKISEVLRDNMSHQSSEINFRVAIPVQSFTPAADGSMKAETLYALFPPPNIGVQDRYITMPLCSENPRRQAQIEGNPSFASSISSHELLFRAKINGLLERREKATA